VRSLVALVAFLSLASCDASDDGSTSGGGADSATSSAATTSSDAASTVSSSAQSTAATSTSTGTGGAPPMLAVGDLVPDFSLLDVNPSSPTSGQPVAPRDYLKQVSGWYFGHST
jgi:hypothetical protein